MLDNILNLTLASIQLDHREANSSVVKFVVELIDIKYSKDVVDQLLKDKMGQRLVDAVINATLFHLPTYFVPDMSDILWLLITWDRNVLLFEPFFVILKVLIDLKTVSKQIGSEGMVGRIPKISSGTKQCNNNDRNS